MIAKILKSGTFADVVGYVMRQFHDPEKYTSDTWRVIDSDGILGDSYRQICNSFDLGHSLNKRKSAPAGHIAVSFDKKDLPRLTDEFMVQLAKEYMERMGIVDTQYIIVRHFETDNPHFHIVYNRVNLHGKSINESNNFDRSGKATKAIKEKYNLTFSPKKKLYEDAKAEMKVKIQAAMYNCKSWDEFKRRLSPAGIDVEIYKNRDTGKPQGVRFTYGDFTFKASAVDRAFSFGRLDKFFNQNAGIRETAHPEARRVQVKFAPKPEPPKANLAADIAETTVQTIGGLFQVGPGYDPEEQAFYNEMQRRQKKNLKKKSGRHL